MRSLLLALTLLGACTHSAPTERAISPRFEGSALEMALLSSPDLRTAQKSIAIAQFELEAIKASNAPLVTGEVGVGANRTAKSSNVAPSATISITKPIFDGGRSEAAIMGAEATLSKVQITHALAADAAATELARALLTRDFAERGLSTLTRAMGRYEPKRALIEMAHASGAITNAAMFEIEDAALTIEQKRIDLKNRIETANLTIAFLLADETAKREAKQRLRHHVDLSTAPNWRLVASERDVDIAEAQRLGQVAAGRASSGLFGGVRAPNTQDTGAELFVGVRVQWTISDAGRNAARIRAMETQRDARALQVTSLIDQIEEADHLAAQRRTNTAQRRNLLRQRIEMSQQKLAELEQLAAAGRADIGQIGREILTATETELALIELEAEQTLDALARAALQGGGCAYLDLCGAIERASFE